ncbi:MAG: MFS transporter [Clostridiales bacterium]|nr:MFS transporter [Clostridiales bacterium]
MKTTTSSSKLFSKDFTIIAIGQLISLLGNSLQRYALSLYILDLTGSAAIFSTILAISVLPSIILAPFGGAIADRLSKKNIMVILDFFSASLLFVFALLIGQNTHQVVLVGILTCTLGVIQSFYDPSVRASIPAVVAKENLGKANGIVTQISAITALIGPIAAGFLYGLFGIESIFTINIISFFLSAVMELFLTIPYTKTPLEGNILITFTKDIRHTFTYLICEKKLILKILLFACASNLFLTPIYTVGVPYVEKIIFHVTDGMYGISEAFLSVGMIIGSMLVGVAQKKIPFRKTYVHFISIAFVVIAMGATTLSFLSTGDQINYLSYVLFTITGFLLALFIAIVNIVFMTFLQLHTPQDKMGKVMALVTAISTALMPIGSIAFGFLYETFKANLIFLYLFVSAITFGVTYLFSRTLSHADAKEIDLPEEATVPETATTINE